MSIISFHINQKHKDITFYIFVALVMAGTLVYTYFKETDMFGIVVAAAMGIITILRTQKNSKREVTIELLTQDMLDGDLNSKLTDFQQLRKKEKSLFKFVETMREPEDEDRKDKEYIQNNRMLILDILNYYEFIACGIREGAFDYRIFHRLYRSNLIGIWDDCESFVLEYRKKVSKVRNIPLEEVCSYQELQCLVEDFKSHKLKSSINK